MKTILLLSSAVLASAFIAPSAMAQDFHALSKMAAKPAAMQDGELASIEGGRMYNRPWSRFWGMRRGPTIVIVIVNQIAIGGAFSVNTNDATIVININTPSPSPPSS
jgi:hypothetical protein